MKTIKIHVARAGYLTEYQKKTFIALCGIMIDVGWIKFVGWETEIDKADCIVAGVWYDAAVFTCQIDCETGSTEAFLRGLAYATTQLVQAA